MHDYELTIPQERWIAALESGDYAQTSSVLYDDGAFCCLGVACAVSDAHVYRNPEGEIAGKDLSCEQVSVQNELDLSDDGEQKLISYNDSGDYTFMQIAEEMRDNPNDFFIYD